MGEEDDPDSESGFTEFRRRVARRRGRHLGEARVWHSSGMSTSSQDPMPEYIDPELVKLIAQNAPLELDVFDQMDFATQEPLQPGKKAGRSPSMHARRGTENDGASRRTAKRDDRRSSAVDVLVSSIKERNEHLFASMEEKEFRRSCPEPLWTDFDDVDEAHCGGKALMRKRRRGSHVHQTAVDGKEAERDGSLRRSARSCMNETQETNVEIATAVLSNEGIENERLRPSTANLSAIRSTPSVSDCKTVDARPWRHGMMTKIMRSTRDVANQPESTCCKRKAEADTRKTFEVRKYIETKELERRKERLQLKAKAHAALAARKERQRNLDLHRQALLQAHVKVPRSRENVPRPEWISEYTGVGEHSRRWSASSSAECSNSHLPPPVTPPKVEPSPLDLYTTQVQYEERNSPTSILDEEAGYHWHDRRRPRAVTERRRELQKQLMYRDYEIMKAFPDRGMDLAAIPDAPIKRNARWKAKARPQEKILSAVDVAHQQLADRYDASLRGRSTDLGIYKRSSKQHSYGNGANIGRNANADSRAHRASKLPSQRTCAKSMEQIETRAKSARKGHGRLPSKVKRLKPSEPVVACEPRELTAREITIMLNKERVSSGCESDSHIPEAGKVIADSLSLRETLSSSGSEQNKCAYLQPSVWPSGRSSSRSVVDEEILVKLVGPSPDTSETVVADEAGPRHCSNLCRESLGLIRHDEVQKQFVDLAARKSDNQRPTGIVHRQRMQMLKNLAKQLMRRVNAACAKKRQGECSAMEHFDGQSLDTQVYVLSEPFCSLSKSAADHDTECVDAGWSSSLMHDGDRSLLGEADHLQEDKLLESELSLCQPTVNGMFLPGRLTEQEQAGCGLAMGRCDEKKATDKSSVPSPGNAKTMAVPCSASVASLTSEICSAMDWTATNKEVDVTCKGTSPHSSLAPSSSSTGSSSPVVLPTNLNYAYHSGRIRYSRSVAKEEYADLAKRECWSLPVERDKHSIINLFTESRKKERGMPIPVTDNHNFQSDVEDGTQDKFKAVSSADGFTAEAKEKNGAFGSIPKAIGDSELHSQERQNLRRDHRFANRNSRSDGHFNTVEDFNSEEEFCPSNLEKHKIPKAASDTSMTLFDKAHTGGMHRVGNSGMQVPEVTLVEIGDLKLSQSPTSLHLRFEDRCEGMRGGDEDPITFNRSSKGTNLTTGSTGINSSRKVSKGRFPRSFIPPMKITYARRCRSRTMPEDGRADVERVVVEVQQLQEPTKGGIVDMNNSISELEPSEESATAELTNPFETSPSDTGEESADKVKHNLQASTKFQKSRRSHSPPLIGTTRPSADSEDAYKAPILQEPATQSTCETNMKFSDVPSRPSIWNSNIEQSNISIGRGQQSSQEALHLKNDDQGRTEVKHKFSRHARRKVRRHAGTETNIGLAGEESNSLKINTQVNLEDVEEQALRFRRNQLEAELQRLDAQIMKTRARLQRSHPMIKDQLQDICNSFTSDQPVEKFTSLDETVKSVGWQSPFPAVCKHQHGEAYHGRSDSQPHGLADSDVKQKFSICEGKKVTASRCGDYQFAIELMEIENKICGIENPSAPDRCFQEQKSEALSSAFTQSKPSKQDGVVNSVKDFVGGHQSDGVEMSIPLPHGRVLRVPDEFPKEALDSSSGRVPGRKHGQPSQLCGPDATATTPMLEAVGPVVTAGQVDDLNLCRSPNDVASTATLNKFDCSGYGQAPMGGRHNVDHGEPYTPPVRVFQEIKRVIETGKNAQMISEQNRKLEEDTTDCLEVLEHIGSDLHDHDSQDAEKGKRLIPRGRLMTVDKISDVEIATGNSERGKNSVHDTEQEVSSAWGRKDGMLCAPVTGAMPRPATSSAINIEELLCGLSHREDENAAAKTKALMSSPDLKTGVDLLDVCPELPLDPLHQTKLYESGIGVVGSLPCRQQTSEITISKEVSFQDYRALCENEIDWLSTSEGRKSFSTSENTHIADVVSLSLPHETGLNADAISLSGTEVTALGQNLHDEMSISSVEEGLGTDTLVLVEGLKENDAVLDTEGGCEPVHGLSVDQSKPKIEHVRKTEAHQESCSSRIMAAIACGVDSLKAPSAQWALDDVRGSFPGERFSFLQHLKPREAGSIRSENEESTISENLQDDESDIAEDLQSDMEILSSVNIACQSQCNSPVPGNICVSACAVDTCRTSSECSERLASDPEPIPSVPDALHAQSNSIDITGRCRDKLLNQLSKDRASAGDKGRSKSLSAEVAHNRDVLTSCASLGIDGPECLQTSAIVNVEKGSLFGSSSGRLVVAAPNGLMAEVDSNDEQFEEESARLGGSFLSNAIVPVTSSKSNSVECVASLPQRAGEVTIRAASVVRHISRAIWVTGALSGEENVQEKGQVRDRLLVETKTSGSTSESDSPEVTEVGSLYAIETSRELLKDRETSCGSSFESTEGVHAQMVVGRARCSLIPMSGLQGEAFVTVHSDGSCMHSLPGLISFPSTIVDGGDTISGCDARGQELLCAVDAKDMIADQKVPTQVHLDFEAREIPGDQICQRVPVQTTATNSAGEVVQKEVRHSLFDTQKEKGHISDELAESVEQENIAVKAPNCPDGEVIWSPTKCDREIIRLGESSREGIQTFTAPLAHASKSTTPLAGSNAVASQREMIQTDRKKTIPVESQPAEKMGWSAVSDCLSIDESCKDLRTCAHSKVLVTEDVEDPLRLDEHRQEMSLRASQILALPPCNTNPSGSSAPALCQEGIVFDLDDVTEVQKVGTTLKEVDCKHESFQDGKHETDSSYTSNDYSLVPSLELGQIVKVHRNCERLAQDPSDCCSIEEDVLSSAPDGSVNDGTLKAIEAPLVKKVVICSQHGQIHCIASKGDGLHSVVCEHKESTCNTLVPSGNVQCKQTLSTSEVPSEEMSLTSPLTRIQGNHGQEQLDGILNNIRRELDTSRAQRQNVLAGMFTDMLYDDLLMEELSGLRHDVGRFPAQKKGRHHIQTLNMSKSLAPIPKKMSRKDSDFCAVLKYFLPAGWRSASNRHKDGSFLHVKGLKPHSLGLVTNSISGGSSKVSAGQYRQHIDFDLSPTIRGASGLRLLDFDNVHPYVTRTVSLSTLPNDPILSNRDNAASLEGEQFIRFVEKQSLGNGHLLVSSRRPMQKLLLDLTNEALQHQWSLGPFMSLKTVPWTTSSESLAELITTGILERERHALRHRFDIDKSIAKVFDDEDRERCSNEAQDVVADLTQAILGDLIERLIHEMIHRQNDDHLIS